jgi:AraC family transcriptional regulator, transcriptional activator of pobA
MIRLPANHPFKIVELTESGAVEQLNTPLPPHRHDAEEVVILTHGKAVHFIDFRKEELTAPVIIYVAMGKMHQFIPDQGTRGWVIHYSNEFIPQTNFQFYSNFLEKNNYRLNEDYCSTTLQSLCEIMLKEYQMEQPDFLLIKHLLSAVLSKLEAESKTKYLDVKASNHVQLITFNNFLKILEYNYRRNEGADFYAEKMNMSTRNLNLISQSVFGKSISDIIETRKMIEARTLLLNTGLSVSEIGYEVGYNEKSYFSRVFRKRTGVTPTDFRNQMQYEVS